MKRLSGKYIDVNLYISQLEKEMNEKALELMSSKYKESVERIIRLCREADELKVYLKTLENLIEIERELQSQVYSEMVRLTGW